MLRMSLDRTTLSTTAAFQRRPPVLNTVMRSAANNSRSPARALQERLGNRATQLLVAGSIGRHAGHAAVGSAAASASHKTCSPGCECKDCKSSHPTGGSLMKGAVDGEGQASLVLVHGAVKSSSALPDRAFLKENVSAPADGGLPGTGMLMPEGATGASPIAHDVAPRSLGANVLPFPASTQLRQTAPEQQPATSAFPTQGSVAGQAHDLSSEVSSRETRHTAAPFGGGAARGQGEAAPASSPKTNAAGQRQAVLNDTVRSEAAIARIAMANRQQVSSVFGGLRARFSGFFAQSSATVQQFVASKQAQLSAAAAETVTSIQAFVARAFTAAEEAANTVRQTIDNTVQGITRSLQTRVQGFADQIVGLINRFPLSNLPGVAQLRSAATAVLRRAADAVTAGLGRVSSLISAALAAGMAVIRFIISVARQVANAAISYVGSVVQRILQMVAQMLTRAAAFIISALQAAFNGTILPILNRIEAMIHQAIARAAQQAIAALRSNRADYLAIAPPVGESSEDSDADELTQDALENNKRIVQTFQESTAIVGQILQRVTTAFTQIVARISQAIAQVIQVITGAVRQALQLFSRIVQAVISFIQQLIQSVTSTLSRVVGYVRALLENPVDQLVRFAQGLVSRMIDFIARIVRNLVNLVTGSPPTETTGFFSPTPSLAPSPAYAPTPLPILIAIFAFIIALLGGTVYLVGGTVIIIIGGSVFFLSVTTVIIILVVLALLLLLLIVYLTYKLKKKKKPNRIVSRTFQRKPGSNTRTTVGVGEEVNLTYTGGSTTWTATAGTFDKTVGARVRWTAPDTAQSVTITAGTASIVFTVLAPSAVFMERRGGRQHTINHADTGVRMRPFLLPDNVNFYRVVYRELDVNATATGVWSCFNSPPVGHCDAGGGGAPCPDIFVSNKVVGGKGTDTDEDDCAYSGDCLTTPPFAPGNIQFNIPHEYRIVGSSSYHSFAPVLQIHTLASDRVTLSTRKDRATDTLNVSAPTSTNGC